MMSKQKDLQNCFLDLQRAATAYYLNPQGKTYAIFLNHAYKILQKKKKLAKFARQIKSLERKSARAAKEEFLNLADEMLTLGLLLKNASRKSK